MKTTKRFLTILFSFFSATLCVAQNEITIGTRDTLYSEILKEKREFWVSVPSSYNKTVLETEYPVVYVLDGPSHFLSLVGMIERFSNNIGNEVCPPMIVVGLVNTDRDRDFIPTFENDNFSKFLKNELIPYIDKHYPSRPYRTLIGHSLGGLRVAHTAIYSNELFNSYIAIDPSLGHDKNKWFNSAMPDIEKLQLKKNRLFIGMGQTMPFNMVKDTASIKKDLSDHSNHMRAIMKFSEIVARKNTNFKWIYYPEETHQSLT
ncbi:MAG TPA: alpha/beta hydrolase-fold protein [Cytophagaceae bacterium]|jgi:hypothetical protein